MKSSMEQAGLHPVILRFRDAAQEARYRAEEDGKCVAIVRVAFMMIAITMLVSAGIMDLFVPREILGTKRLTPAGGIGTLVMMAALAATYLPPARRHPQATVAVLCILIGGITGWSVHRLPTEFATHRGFMFLVILVVIICTLLRLRFVPGAVAAWVAIALYLLVMMIQDTVKPADLARHWFWLFSAGFWGTWICHQLDLRSRREFAGREALEAERARAERLLRNILPDAIAARLKDSHEPIAEHHGEVTVLFADIVGFTPLSARRQPADLVDLLDRVFTRFDVLASSHGLEKIKTIGDAYMAVAGLPHPQPDHAARAARMAVELFEAVRQVAAESGEELEVRVGLHTGPVVAGVIGRSKFSYDLWGDTVNTASRMESQGLPGKVHCSPQTAACLTGQFALQPRGRIEVKGKGAMETFLLQPA